MFRLLKMGIGKAEEKLLQALFPEICSNVPHGVGSQYGYIIELTVNLLCLPFHDGIRSSNF